MTHPPRGRFRRFLANTDIGGRTLFVALVAVPLAMWLTALARGQPDHVSVLFPVAFVAMAMFRNDMARHFRGVLVALQLLALAILVFFFFLTGFAWSRAVSTVALAYLAAGVQTGGAFWLLSDASVTRWPPQSDEPGDDADQPA